MLVIMCLYRCETARICHVDIADFVEMDTTVSSGGFSRPYKNSSYKYRRLYEETMCVSMLVLKFE